MVRPRASRPSTRSRPLKTTPKAYLQQHRATETSVSLRVRPQLRDSFHARLSQFTVLDEDALGELVSFFQDLLVVDVGHGGDEALEEDEDVTDSQRSQLLQRPVPPFLPRQRRHP